MTTVFLFKPLVTVVLLFYDAFSLFESHFVLPIPAALTVYEAATLHI